MNNVYYSDNGLMINIPLEEYIELIEYRGRYKELKENSKSSVIRVGDGFAREPVDLSKIYSNTITVDGRGLAYDYSGNRPESK